MTKFIIEYMRKDISPYKIHSWYSDLWVKLTGKTYDPMKACSKLVEESIEVLFSAGYTPGEILDICSKCVEKESKKVHSKLGFIDELVDVGIVLKTLIGDTNVWIAYCQLEHTKYIKNVFERKWRVNEFGSLSHDRRQAQQHHWQGEDRRCKPILNGAEHLTE